MQTILLSISFANSTYSKERSKKLADSISSLRKVKKSILLLLLKNWYWTKKGVSSLLSVCLTKLTTLSRSSGRSYFRAYHIQCGPDGGSPFGTIHFLSSSHQKTCEKTWLRGEKMRHPVVFKHSGQETKTRLVNPKKTQRMTDMTCGQFELFFRIVDTLKCVYIQRLKRG